jgi:hypothetical protein
LKTPDKYRFSLQWGAATAEGMQAGELLESLGNRKSEFVVMAVSDYVKAHPEVLTPGQKLKIVVKPSFTREQLEAIVREMIEEKLAASGPAEQAGSSLAAESSADESGVEAMLRNLDLFA